MIIVGSSLVPSSDDDQVLTAEISCDAEQPICLIKHNKIDL